MSFEKTEQERKGGQLYRVAVNNLRERWAWEYGKSAASPEAEEPRTLFPNLVAEMSASGYSFCTFANHANVSPEIILAVIQNSESLLASECLALANLFSCNMECLFGHSMQMVDPATSEDKTLLHRLVDLSTQLGDYTSIYRARTQGVIKNLQAGRCITYAEYRWAYIDLLDNLRWTQREESSGQTRRERITA